MQKNFKNKINLFEPYFDKFEKENLNKVINSGWVTSGPLSLKFENEVKKFIGTKNAIAVNSCTNGIIATIQALKLKPGDEVITSPMTFVSVIHALELFKLKIKLVDVTLDNFSFNDEIVKKSISKKTKCIIITHYGGLPVDISKISALCKKKKIFLIEDAATAFGAKIKKKNVGSSDYSISVFSFYANKIITTGEGGIISLKNKQLANKIRSIISCGIDKDPWKRTFEKKMWFYNVKNFGFKFNFTDLQAALGLAQLKKLKNIINKRKKFRKLYDKNLKDIIHKKIIFVQNSKKGYFNSEYIYTILLNKNKFFLRDKLISFLKENNISSTVHYIPANQHSYYKKKFINFKLINSDYIFNNVISLPFHNKLNTRDITRVTNVIKLFFKNNDV